MNGVLLAAKVCFWRTYSQISKGQGADRLGKQLRDRSPKNVWLSICKKLKGQECTPYSSGIDTPMLLIIGSTKKELIDNQSK